MPFIYVYLFLLAMFCCFLIAYSVKSNAADAKLFQHQESDPFSSKNYPTLEECGITEEQMFGGKSKIVKTHVKEFNIPYVDIKVLEEDKPSQ